MDDRSFVAAQAFILETKKYWTSEIYPALKADYRAKVEKAGREPESAADVNALIGDGLLYQTYAWLERSLQRFKYSGRYGLAPYHRQHRAELVAKVGAMARPQQLDLDADFVQPKYYTAVDIHQHPGGVWRDDFAAHVYERGARSTTPLAGARHRDLHQRFTDLVAAGGTPKRILDMGCGFGKSTLPFCVSFPEAEIEALELSGPCAAYGAASAAEAGVGNVRFRQMNAYETDYAADEFDLVTSTMLIHELPPKQIEALFDENWRLLAPGGRMVHLDFYHLPNAFARFIHYGHGRRNNEPFMEPWAELDLVGLLAAKGFRNIQIEPFAESEDADLEDSHNWRFPWTVISAEK